MDRTLPGPRLIESADFGSFHQLRDRYNSFIRRHAMAWELAMGGLAVAWVVLAFLTDDPSGGVRSALEYLDVSLTMLFVVEFGSRLFAAKSRPQYIRNHLIDAVALVPPLRAFRLLRLVRLFRAFSAVYRASMRFQVLARHRGFAWLGLAWLAILFICSTLVFLAERATNQSINDPFEALWWGVSTITTVVSGDMTPLTQEGRIGAMVLMLLGIVLFSTLTAAFTSYFVSTESPSAPRLDTVVERLQKLATLRSEGSLTDAEFTAAKAVAIGGA